MISCNPAKDFTVRFYIYVFDDERSFGTRLRFDTQQKKYIIFGPHYFNDRCYMKQLN
jgi:hypothetical protein